MLCTRVPIHKTQSYQCGIEQPELLSVVCPISAGADECASQHTL